MSVQAIETPIRIVELGARETHDMFTASRSTPAFHLLTKNGEYMYASGSDDPITAGDWATAQQLARTNGAAFLFALHHRDAFFFHEPKTEGLGSWRPAALYPHADFKRYHNTSIIIGEIHEKKKRPSGAQNRRRYGHRSRKR